MSQIQELEEKIKILKQIEALDAPDELKKQFKDLVDKPKQADAYAEDVQSQSKKGATLKYNKPEYDQIIDSLEIEDELKEKLKIVNHHLVKTSIWTGAKYKGYNTFKMFNWGASFCPPLKYYQAGFSKKWLMMIPGWTCGGYHYYPDLFRKLVLKEEDFWW